MSATLWEFFLGALATRAAAVASGLGIADALAEGPRSVAELAAEAGADPDALNRILRALAGEGVFAEVEPGVYRNTEASALLGRDSAWGAFAQLFGGAWLEAIARLDATGAQSFEGDFWTWLAAHPRERHLFDAAMEEGKERRVERLAGLEWRGGETVVDVGGGNGSFLLELLARQPGLHGIVVDLPETVRDEAALATAGIEFVEGSFFDRVPEGDVYVLGTILHDWPDEQAAAILRTIHRAAPTGARLLAVEAVVQPGNEPQGAKWMDLLMLALFAGRERDETQWRELLGATGFRLDAVRDGLVQATCL